MFRVTRYPMISKTESGRVGYRKKYRVAGRVRVPAGHCFLGIDGEIWGWNSYNITTIFNAQKRVLKNTPCKIGQMFK